MARTAPELDEGTYRVRRELGLLRRTSPEMEAICSCGHPRFEHKLAEDRGADADIDLCWGHKHNGHACDCRWLNTVNIADR